MRCPFCNAQDTRVIDSRVVGDGYQVRRRRRCDRCSERFTSHEAPELSMPRIIKSDGRRESFSDEKLRAGMLRALQKRPVATERIEQSIGHIQRHLLGCGEREVASRTIGDLVMAELRGLDQVAFVRFASVYRRFEDVQAFLEEIEQLEKELPPEARQVQLDLLALDKGVG